MTGLPARSPARPPGRAAAPAASFGHRKTAGAVLGAFCRRALACRPPSGQPETMEGTSRAPLPRRTSCMMPGTRRPRARRAPPASTAPPPRKQQGHQRRLRRARRRGAAVEAAGPGCDPHGVRRPDDEHEVDEEQGHADADLPAGGRPLRLIHPFPVHRRPVRGRLFPLSACVSACGQRAAAADTAHEYGYSDVPFSLLLARRRRCPAQDRAWGPGRRAVSRRGGRSPARPGPCRCPGRRGRPGRGGP